MKNSLKIQFYFGATILVLAAILGLGSGVYLGGTIKDESQSLEQDRLPRLLVSQSLTNLVMESRAAVMKAIDGDDEFEVELLELNAKFERIIKNNAHIKELQPIQANYVAFVSAGQIFGRNVLKNPETLHPEELDRLSFLANSVKKMIDEYYDSELNSFKRASSYIQKSSKAILLGQIAIFTLLISLIVVFSIKVNKTITSIVRLRGDAKILTSGDLQKPIAVSSSDEIGVLQEAFESMRQSLLKTIFSLRRSNEQLQEKITEAEEATQIASQEKINAIQANRAKSEFLSIMSHEIRTPMNGIMGMVTLMQQGDLDDEQKGYAEGALRSTENLLLVLNDILDFSRLETNRFNLEVGKFKMANVLDKVRQYVENTLYSKKGLRFIDKTGIINEQMYMGDAKRLSQILIQFMSNAIKFTESGFVEISIGSKPDIDNKEKLFFKVKDSGIGIGEKDQEVIYDSFKLLDGAMNRRHGGVGIGLTLVKRIVELMGGRYGVYSELGNGSEFWFEISLTRLNLEHYPMEVEGPVDDEDILREKIQNYIRKNDPQVLVVEDQKMNLKVLLKLLEKLGLQSDAAFDGFEAWEKAQEKHYDLILMDCQMPKMDGLEATQNIRANSKCKDSQIIAVTANALDSDKKNCINAGMNDFVSKPIKLSVMIEVLAKAFIK